MPFRPRNLINPLKPHIRHHYYSLIVPSYPALSPSAPCSSQCRPPPSTLPSSPLPIATARLRLTIGAVSRISESCQARLPRQLTLKSSTALAASHRRPAPSGNLPLARRHRRRPFRPIFLPSPRHRPIKTYHCTQPSGPGTHESEMESHAKLSSSNHLRARILSSAPHRDQSPRGRCSQLVSMSR